MKLRDFNGVSQRGIMSEEAFYWRRYLESKDTTASKIVNCVLQDLTDRKGIGREFNMCDDEIKREICDALLEQVGLIVTATKGEI